MLLGSCSLSTIHVGGVDAGDLFGRVEAIPREHVIATVDTNKTWSGGQHHIGALEALPQGPNVASFIGHSYTRAATMGLDRATRKDKRRRAEQAAIELMLAEAVAAGFVGISSQQLLFDKLDGDTCRSRTLPSTYAKSRKLRRLKSLLRRSWRVLQSGPDIQNPLNLLFQLAQSVSLFRRKLKTSLLSASDVKANLYAIRIMGRSARLVGHQGEKPNGYGSNGFGQDSTNPAGMATRACDEGTFAVADKESLQDVITDPGGALARVLLCSASSVCWWTWRPLSARCLAPQEHLAPESVHTRVWDPTPRAPAKSGHQIRLGRHADQQDHARCDQRWLRSTGRGVDI